MSAPVLQTAQVQANFSANPPDGYAPLEVGFIDESTTQGGEIDRWLWDFGDGMVSTQPNPSHEYALGGVYSVRLTVWSGIYLDTASMEIRVSPLEPVLVSEDGNEAQKGRVAIASTDHEEALVVWSQLNDGQWDIVARRVDNEGHVLSDPFLVVTNTADQVDPVVAYAAGAERYLVAWEDHRSGDKNEDNVPVSDLYGQLIDRSGSLVGGEFLIQMGDRAGDGWNIGADQLSLLANPSTGNWVLVWVDRGLPEGDSAMFARLVDPDGTIGERARLVARGGWPFWPNIILAPGGGYLLAWSDDPNNWDVAIRTVSDDFQVLGEPVIVYSSPIHDTNPQVVYNPSRDEYLVVWYHHPLGEDPDLHQVMGQWVQRDGTLSGEPFTLDMPDASNVTEITGLSAGYDPGTGQILVVWQDACSDGMHIYGQLVGPDGRPQGQTMQLAPGPGEQFDPAVGDVDYGYLLGWRDIASGERILDAILRPILVDLETYGDTTGLAPLTVSFQDRSEPADEIGQWLWDFGDGTTSSERDPVHTYTLPGSYTVTLTACSSRLCQTEAKADLVMVAPVEPSALQILLPGEESTPGIPPGKEGYPLEQKAGVSFEMIVRAVDAQWNLAPIAATVTLSSTDSQAELPATASLVDGQATVMVTLKTAGEHTFGAEDPDLGAVMSEMVSVSAGTPVSLTMQAPETAELFAPVPITMTLSDAYGNLAEGWVDLANSDGEILEGGYVWGERVASVHLFRSGLYTFTATLRTPSLIQTVTIETLPGDAIVTDAVSLPPGVYTYPNVIVRQGATLVLRGDQNSGTGVTLYAENLTVESGAGFWADWQGYRGEMGPGAGHNGSGAGHGGWGGANQGNSGGAPYGSLYQPVTLGSGGGSMPSYSGESGGGAIHLIISDTLMLNGVMSANGDSCEQVGGGSGGSIWIETRIITGTGLIGADGGRGIGGGAGGRIALYAGEDHLTGIIRARGGGGNAPGQPGTIYLNRVDPLSSTLAVPGLIAGKTDDILTVTLVTTAGLPVASEPVSLKLLAGEAMKINGVDAPSGGMVSIGATNAAGVVTATLSSRRVGTGTLEAWCGPAQRQLRLLNTAQIVMGTGPTDPDRSSVQLDPTQVAANGQTPLQVTVVLSDAFDNPIAGHQVRLQADGTAITVTQPVSPTNAAGMATGQLVSTRAQTVTIAVLDTTSGMTLTTRPVALFVPGPVVTATSTLAVTPDQAVADGKEAVTATVTLRDAFGNVVPGKVVTVYASGSAITITPLLTTTNAFGQIYATIVSRDVQTVMVTAVDATDGLTLTLSIPVAFTPDRSLLTVAIHHSAPVTGVKVLPETAVPVPGYVVSDSWQTQLGWSEVLTPDHRLETATFQAQLTGLRPGEARQVANGTVVSYTGADGSGQIVLGPLYVAAAHIVAIAPSRQEAVPGATVAYSINLYNPSAQTDTYTVSIGGLPSDWIPAPFSVALAGQQQRIETVTLVLPDDADLGDYALTVMVESGYGGRDAASASLSVVGSPHAGVAPKSRPATPVLVSLPEQIASHDEANMGASIHRQAGQTKMAENGRKQPTLIDWDLQPVALAPGAGAADFRRHR
jgi:PKD repeat protein